MIHLIPMCISAIVEKFHLNLPSEEIKQLITKYDFKSEGKFAYCDFLQSCVLLFKQKETTPLQRVVIQNPRIQVNILEVNRGNCDVIGD